MTSSPRSLLVVAMAGICVAAAGCSQPAPSPSAPAAPPSSATGSANGSPAGPTNGSAEPNAEQSGHAGVTATFASDSTAKNYDKTLVPDGAKVLVAENVFDGSTTVTLNVRGLVPNRRYGAHAHAKPCGPTGDDAGPHFQHQPDPVKPSVDPAFANSKNEIWLDFTTDAQGNATSASTVPWLFTDARAASVVIHAQPTLTAPGKAGTAGARAACVSVSF